MRALMLLIVCACFSVVLNATADNGCVQGTEPWKVFGAKRTDGSTYTIPMQYNWYKTPATPCAEWPIKWDNKPLEYMTLKSPDFASFEKEDISRLAEGNHIWLNDSNRIADPSAAYNCFAYVVGLGNVWVENYGAVFWIFSTHVESTVGDVIFYGSDLEEEAPFFIHANKKASANPNLTEGKYGGAGVYMTPGNVPQFVYGAPEAMYMVHNPQ